MATGVLGPYGKGQWFDDNGAPLNGGLLYSYEAGTTTPLATYTTAALTVANANPLVLDSAGRGLYFLAPSTAYKLVLKTSAGVTIWTVDNVVFSTETVSVLSKSGDYTVVTADGDDVLILADASSASFTISLYTAVGNSGKRITVLRTDSTLNTVTIDPNGSELIGGISTWVLRSPGYGVGIVSNGSAWLIANRVGFNYTAKTATYTVRADDDVVVVTSGTFTVDLPTAVGFGMRQLIINNQGSGTVTVDPSGAETINGNSTMTLLQYDSMTLVSNNVNWIIV